MAQATPIRRYEVAFLRPLWMIAVFALIALALRGYWWSVGVAVISLAYIGAIGAGLHPSLTANELTEGPVDSAPSQREAVILSQEIQHALIDRACTHTGILLGVWLCWAGIAFLRWHWFVVLPAAWFLAVFTAGFARFRFGTRMLQ